MERVYNASYSPSDSERFDAGLLTQSSTESILEHCFNGSKYPPELLKSLKASQDSHGVGTSSMVAVPASNRKETRQQQHNQQQHKHHQSSSVPAAQLHASRQQHEPLDAMNRGHLMTAVPASDHPQQPESRSIGVNSAMMDPEAVAYRVVMINYIPLGSMKAQVQQLFEQVAMSLLAGCLFSCRWGK